MSIAVLFNNILKFKLIFKFTKKFTGKLDIQIKLLFFLS